MWALGQTAWVLISLAVWPQASHLTSLFFSFLICDVRDDNNPYFTVGFGRFSQFQQAKCNVITPMSAVTVPAVMCCHSKRVRNRRLQDTDRPTWIPGVWGPRRRPGPLVAPRGRASLLPPAGGRDYPQMKGDTCQS